MKPVRSSKWLPFCLAGILLFAGTSFSPATAQPPASFFVFSIKGSGYYLRDKFRIPLKIGSALAVTDQLALNPHTEVQLLCNKYSLLKLQSAAAGTTMALQSYAASCKDAGKSMVTQTLSYVWNRFTSEETDVTSDKNNNLGEYGADTRGCADPVFNTFPDSLVVYRGPLLLRYHPADTAEKYQMLIFADPKNRFPLYHASLAAGRFVLPDTVLQSLDTAAIYYYTVTRNGQEPCLRKILRRAGRGTLATIIAEAAAGEGFQKLSSPEQDLVTGIFLEKAHLLAEALRLYRRIPEESRGKIPGSFEKTVSVRKLASLQSANLDALIGQ